MATKRAAAVVLVAALAALVVSVAWGFTEAGNRGWSMSRSGPGMMGYSSSGGGEPVRDLAGAKRQAQRFAERLDLRVGEVMQFENNYYVELVESSGELGTEVLVDPTTGAVSVEYGPAMMWNTRYGMMGESRWGGRSGMMSGMMGGSGAGAMMSGDFRGDPTWTPSPVTAKPSVSAQEAEAIAARWLAREQRGQTRFRDGGGRHIRGVVRSAPHTQPRSTDGLGGGGHHNPADVASAPITKSSLLRTASSRSLTIISSIASASSPGAVSIAASTSACAVALSEPAQ